MTTNVEPIRACIADDEPLARSHLRHVLEPLGVKIVGEAQNGLEALQLTEDLKPDVLFLDIQMPGISGMQLATALLHLDDPPIIVFVTGYSEHALTAFETDALDYIVKPAATERVARTVEKARQRLADINMRKVSANLILEKSKETPMTRIAVREGYSVHLVRVEDVYCATARNRRVYIWTEAREFRTYYSLTQLEEMLPRQQFVRVHDSAIVSLDRVEEIILLGNHSYMVRLSNSHQIPVGRSRYAELQRRLGMDASVG